MSEYLSITYDNSIGQLLNVAFIRFVRRRLATVISFGIGAIAVTSYVLTPEGARRRLKTYYELFTDIQ